MKLTDQSPEHTTNAGDAPVEFEWTSWAWRPPIDADYPIEARRPNQEVMVINGPPHPFWNVSGIFWRRIAKPASGAPMTTPKNPVEIELGTVAAGDTIVGFDLPAIMRHVASDLAAQQTDLEPEFVKVLSDNRAALYLDNEPEVAMTAPSDEEIDSALDMLDRMAMGSLPRMLGLPEGLPLRENPTAGNLARIIRSLRQQLAAKDSIGDGPAALPVGPSGLAPCPFCGASANSDPSSDGEGHVVYCSNVKCEAEIKGGYKQGAIDAWNRRSRPVAEGSAEGASVRNSGKEE